MLNPILQAMQQKIPQTPMQNSPIAQVINAVRSSGNPQEMVMNMLKSNPAVASMVNQANSSGQSYKDLFYAAAKAKGVDPDQILNQLR